jgi:hypothetical protein
MVPIVNKLLADSVTYTVSGPGLSPTDGVTATTMLEKVISNLIGILTLVAVIYFIIQIILAGFGFMSSEGDEKKMEMNRSKLTNGVMGLFIVVIAVGIGSLIAKLLGLNNPLDINQMFINMKL